LSRVRPTRLAHAATCSHLHCPVACKLIV
jgi:hypothetical protein